MPMSIIWANNKNALSHFQHAEDLIGVLSLIMRARVLNLLAYHDILL